MPRRQQSAPASPRSGLGVSANLQGLFFSGTGIVLEMLSIRRQSILNDDMMAGIWFRTSDQNVKSFLGS